MAKYTVKAGSYINDRIVAAGEVVEYSGRVGPDDLHLELVDTPENLKAAEAEAKAAEKAYRDEAIKAKLTEEPGGKGKRIGPDTSIDVVMARLADHKQSNPFT